MENKKELIIKVLSFIISILIIVGILKICDEYIESVVIVYFLGGMLFLILNSLPFFIITLSLLYIIYLMSVITYKYLIKQKFSNFWVTKKQWIIILILTQVLIVGYFLYPIVVRDGFLVVSTMMIVDFVLIYLIYLFSKFIYKIIQIIRGKNNE